MIGIGASSSVHSSSGSWTITPNELCIPLQKCYLCARSKCYPCAQSYKPYISLLRPWAVVVRVTVVGVAGRRRHTKC